ncbi:hypothetical protein SLE2022_259220 [Rubroshorea leprosula]
MKSYIEITTKKRCFRTPTFQQDLCVKKISQESAKASTTSTGEIMQLCPTKQSLGPSLRLILSVSIKLEAPACFHKWYTSECSNQQCDNEQHHKCITMANFH